MTRKHDGGQGHHNQSNPQSIAYKHNGGVEQVNTDLEPKNILEEKKEWFTNGLTTMMCGKITPTHLQTELKLGAPTHLKVTLVCTTLPKPNITVN